MLPPDKPDKFEQDEISGENPDIPDGWHPNDWKDLLDDIEHETCIPIIGRSLSRVIIDGESVDLYKAFLDDFNSQSIGANDAESMDELFFSNQQNLTELKKKRKFNKFTQDAQIDSEPLEKLLANWTYPVIVNLCPSGVCEQALENLNIPFLPVNISATEGIPSVGDMPNDNTTTLINVFHSACDNYEHIALATNQQLTSLLSLAVKGTTDYFPLPLGHYQFLGVGCQTPDWLGRILIHWLSQGSSVSEVRLSSVDERKDHDRRFREYTALGGQYFKFVSSNPLQFCANFQNYIKSVRQCKPTKEETSQSRNEDINESINPSVFFSFIGDPDRDAVINFYSRYHNLTAIPGIDIPVAFVDEKMEPGEQGMNEILRKLDSMEQFVIFASEQSIHRVSQNGESDAFQEWDKIIEKVRRMGNRKGVLYVVFIYDDYPDREREEMNELLHTRFDDPENTFKRLFLSKSSAPQVIYFPRDPSQDQARYKACKQLGEALAKGRL